MKKKNLLLMSIVLISSLVSCNNNRHSSSSTSSANPSQEESVSLSETPSSEESSANIPLLNEDSVQIHYKRSDNNYASWALWLWQNGLDGNEYLFNYQDDFGAVASYPLSTFGPSVVEKGLGFIVKSAGSWDLKDVDSDRFIDFSTFTKDHNNVYHVYLLQEDENIYESAELKIQDKVENARFRDSQTLQITTNKAIDSYEIFEDGVSLVKADGASKTSISHKFDTPVAKIDKEYTVEVTFKESGNVINTRVSTRALYKTKDFIDTYVYDGELGVIYSSTSTTFKVWSPVSTKINLKLYNTGTPKSIDKASGEDNAYFVQEMTKDAKGVFSLTVDGDLDGKYYTFEVFNYAHREGKEIVDPYAYSTGINGLRGQVVNFAKTNPEGWDDISPLSIDDNEMVVYETHVADVTSSSTWTGSESSRKKFLGLIEEGTTYTANGETVTTGFDHIKDLKVNAVQLIPIFDQANDEVNPTFNWGYNPLNYNALEGSYSSNPYNGYTKIKEFKEVVKAYRNNGMNIIMDVVYNHVMSAGGSSFDVLMPYYYFRYDSKDQLTNGSGCGNETASDNEMFRKFMIDSASFWAREYKLGGFRFDLMGLHDMNTMNQLTAKVKEINPSIKVYGEPWTGGTTPLAQAYQAVQANASRFEGYGQFNDQMRDALIRGGMAGPTEKGWVSNTTRVVTNDVKKISGGLQGFTHNGTASLAEPSKTINYVTCHDNYTLFDRFQAAGIKDVDTVKKMATLANAVILSSQATSFVLAGEEFYRTKQGSHNSYNLSYEVNELDYQLKIDNPQQFETFKKLIDFKKTVSQLGLTTEEAKNIQVETIDSGRSIAVHYTKNDKEYIAIHTNGTGSTSSYDLSDYTLMFDTMNTIPEASALSTVELTSFQSIFAYKA